MSWSPTICRLSLFGLLLTGLHAADANHATVGGGSTHAGFQGEYFANPDFSGAPAFTRRDVRINYDWQEGAAGRGLPVGGATTPGMKEFPLDNYSIRWTGQVVPRFSESYTLRVTGLDGVRCTFAGKVVVDSLDQGITREVSTGPLKAGTAYDLIFAYVDRPGTNASVARLEWSSPSTPWEIIEPLSVAQTCLHQANPGVYQALETADVVRMSTDVWRGADKKPLDGDKADANGWPKVADCTIGLSCYGEKTYSGTYQIRFTGKAAVAVQGGMGGTWNTKADGTGTVSKGPLPKGMGYSETDNTTTAWFLANRSGHFALQFTEAERGPGQPGLADLHVYYPIADGAAEAHQPGEIYTREARRYFQDFVVLRQHMGTSCSPGWTWADRTPPAYYRRNRPDAAYCLEELIMAVNDAGKDLHLCYGAGWDDDFLRKLAQLVRYGSDGVNPYDHYVENPVYPPLNPNLRIYLEHANELPWAVYPVFIWEDLRKKALANHPDWQVISYDGKVTHDATGGDYGYHGMYRYHALRMVRASQAFRSVYADAPSAMGDRVRVMALGQYDAVQLNTMLQFIDNYFNNADGRKNVADPHPPSYYLWGGGGAIYYGCANKFGLTKQEAIPNAGFEDVRLPAGAAALRPTDAGWAFTGNAGICNVQAPRRAAIASRQLPASPVQALAKDQWMGCKFTVGDKDLYVYQLGRWVAKGSKDGHALAIFSADGARIVEQSLATHSATPDAVAYVWCSMHSAGHDRVMPAYLQAGKTYYLVSREKAGKDVDRFFGTDTRVTAAPGIAIQAAVSSADGKTWQETPGEAAFGPVDMIFTDQVLQTADGVVGQPPDSSDYPYDFPLGTQCAFLQGASGMRRDFTIDKAGAYWVTFNLAIDRPTNGYTRQNWGGWTVAHGGNSIRVLVDGVDQTPTLLPQGGYDYFAHAYHYAATRALRLEPGQHNVAFERVNHANGTMFIDEVHLSSEEAFYGGRLAPNFPAGGNAFGQDAASGYHRTAQAECEVPRNWGLVPVTYEGGWAVQGDFDHYSMLAWNDLRYGSKATDPDLTKQALRNAFDIWCAKGGFTYAYFYPLRPLAGIADSPLLSCLRELNDRLPIEADCGTPIPGVLGCEQPHYQNSPDGDYYGFNSVKTKAGPLLRPSTWKAWNVIAGETTDYAILVVGSPGGTCELTVDGVLRSTCPTGDPATQPTVVRLTKGQHNVRICSTGSLCFLQQVLVGKAGQALPQAATGKQALSFPSKPADAVLDLRPACNRDLVDNPTGKRGWAAFDADSCIKDLKPGRTDFGYKLVSFDIIDGSANGGNGCIVLSGPQRKDVFPEKSAAIAVNRSAAALFFLHTAMCVQAAPGEELVRYRIAYADGGEEVFACRNREDLGDWWGLPNLKNGLSVHSERSRCLMLTPWKNPHPEKPIASITMESTGKAIPILLAITASANLDEYQVVRSVLE